MEELTKLQVWLSTSEWEALRSVAQRQYRHPREQARYIIRHALLGDADKSATDTTGTLTATPRAEAATA